MRQQRQRHGNSQSIADRQCGASADDLLGRIGSDWRQSDCQRRFGQWVHLFLVAINGLEQRDGGQPNGVADEYDNLYGNGH